MSTHSLNIIMQRGIGLPVRLVLGAVLLFTALLLALPASAFAFASSTAPSADPAQNLAQAGVSVVRLVVTYTATGNVPPPKNTPISSPGNLLQCTGLGVLVSSSVPSGDATTKNTWILTDGNLVAPNKMTCATGNTALPTSVQLSQIQVFVSNLYTNTKPNNASLGTFPVKTGDVTCASEADCGQGLALFGFFSPNVQPYINLAQSSTSNAGQGIELINSGASSLPSALQAQQFLTPHLVPSASAVAEAGMPLVDASGSLMGMHLSGTATPATVADITALMEKTPPFKTNPGNLVRDNWNSGIQAYYVTKKYTQAQSAFQNAARANPQFQAGTLFAGLAAAKLQASGSAGNGHSATSPTGSTSKGSSTFLSAPLLVGSILALIVLVVILVAVSLIRRRRGFARFKQDEKSAQQKAEKDAQYIASMESQQRPGQSAGWSNPPPPVVTAQAGAPVMNASNGQMPTSGVPTVPMSSGAPLPPSGPVPPQMSPVMPQMSPVREAPCPHCGTAIPITSQSCPNCHTWLSPSDSGLRLQVNPQQQGMPVDMETTRPFAPQSPVSSVPSYRVENQPTLVPLPPEPQGNGLEDTEKTIPYSIQQAGNGRVGLVVGTRTDPGIKRKHKPNEDSVFAAQGEGMFNSSPQPFGLFVVADGMGGHANGQDASRLAIQTIINHMLPQISKGENLDREALKNLLVGGVQRANDAVFQHNMEQRADMGTTMTAALVVGSTAIVANVGDSRTYLYREPEGLKKITNDHSVVASLVEAGIIKPDDIYTHPKRNQIYRSLGEKPAVEVDFFFVDLIPGDELLLCSDGLWDMVRDPNILQVLRGAAHNPDQTGDGLIQAALNGGGEDNVSVIIVSITNNDQYTGITGINLLTKPETVQMPQL